MTGGSALEASKDAHARYGIGNGRTAAFVSAMGSAGTIAAGDRLKDAHPETRIVGLEPTQCPTLYENGYGGHDIQGIGDKHVTWIHNVMNMDLLCCLDDVECKKALQVLVEEPGREALQAEGIDGCDLQTLALTFGISGLCNLLGAIKTAKYYGFGKDDVVVTVATDSIERYHSVMTELSGEDGAMDVSEAKRRIEGIFRGQRLDWTQEGTRHNRERWHNLKYYTWVEQQGRTTEDLDALRTQETWIAEQEKIPAIDEALRKARKAACPV